ncbi:RDD family protein [Imtechella halotolerans]|uniref:RDD domain-containing protein n=1 Tax=Imtechella halotolerans K1 TaxID=946077 RepID=I0WBW2_9FLAO|nr:RDD family protein [Imtechella halotolerans]EID73878.1 RDD domain-containing protein [Imtechella halotolerans K1]WMQ64088.1 RDD family protein [Imtechella halotolerans]
MTEIKESQYHLSSRKRRIIAFLIDHFIVTFLMVVAVFLMLGPNFMDTDNVGNLTSKIGPTVLLGFLVYFAKDSIKGISPGKWIMGIMVRDEHNLDQVPSIGTLLIRNLFLLIWPIECIVLVFSKEKKRLGDRIGKTVVVKNPVRSSLYLRISVLAVMGISYFFFIFLFVGNTVKNSEVYKLAISEIEVNEEIQIETGGIKGYGMIPKGTVRITDHVGEANLSIKVLGNQKDLDVGVYLRKEPNENWRLIELNK